MQIYNESLNNESWYTCLNCNLEYELHETLLLSLENVECPYCESKQFIKSKQSFNDSSGSFYDYSGYDIYDEYY